MPTREGSAHWQGTLKQGCPVSKALEAVDISLQADLAG
jgi:hypothetical protein